MNREIADIKEKMCWLDAVLQACMNNSIARGALGQWVMNM